MKNGSSGSRACARARSCRRKTSSSLSCWRGYSFLSLYSLSLSSQEAVRIRKQEDTEQVLSSDIRDNGDYEKYLEEKTARVLEDVEGVGEVTVMITLKSDGQKIIEKDQSSSSQSTDEADSGGGTRSVEDQSSDKTSIYEQAADGTSHPM